jgi:PAS domain-containing protein
MTETDYKEFIEVLNTVHSKVATAVINLTKYDYMPRCIWDWDAKFIFVNEKFANCFGYTASEMNGKPFSDFIYPEDLHKSMDEYTRNIQGHNISMIAGFMNRYVCKDGSIVNVLWYGYNDFENYLGSGQIEIMKAETATVKTAL